MKRMMALIALVLLTLLRPAYAVNVADYLILQDIGPYKFSTVGFDPFTDKVLTTLGYTVVSADRILGGTGHFPDNEVSYEIFYPSLGRDDLSSPKVIITQHAGSDSDRWILHEVDLPFRGGGGPTPGVPNRPYKIRNIDNNTVMVYGAGGRDYRWLSGNKVISIEYHDSQMTKPEPLEVVRTYLAKHPSTLSATMTIATLRSTEAKTKWITDEMERRLWLCDKWFAQLDAGKATQKDLLWNVKSSIEDFLRYRQKYYEVGGLSDFRQAEGFEKNSDAAGMRKKLTDLKSWWTSNKGNALMNLP